MAMARLSCCFLTELPDAVILEILLKLPIKSVMVCRCVCKSFYNLTFDPIFTLNYFNNPPFTLAVCEYNWPGKFHLLEIGRDSDDVIHTPFHPKALSFNTDGTLRVCGSCNGLLCVVHVINVQHCDDNGFLRNKMTEETVYIVNPLLGEFTRLPKIEIRKTEFMVDCYFGCTREANQYKVLRVAINYEYKILHAEVFTIGVDDEWRSLNDSFPSVLKLSSYRDVCFNGVIHFLRYDLSFILCFDVEEEREKRISFPPGRRGRGGMCTLVVLNDKLCYTETNCGCGIDIWVMKEHGICESWSKEIILGRWMIPSKFSYLPQFISASRDRDLLMWTSNTILSLDPRAKVPHRKVWRTYEVRGHDIIPYVPRFFP